MPINNHIGIAPNQNHLEGADIIKWQTIKIVATKGEDGATVTVKVQPLNC